jgi:hypothetical protein
MRFAAGAAFASSDDCCVEGVTRGLMRADIM